MAVAGHGSLDSNGTYPPQKPGSLDSNGTYPPKKPGSLDSNGTYPPEKPGSLDSNGTYPPEKPGSLDSNGTYPPKKPSGDSNYRIANDCDRHGPCSDDLPFRRFFQVLLALLLILLFVVLIIYLALHPHKPLFYLQNATVRELNLSDGFLTSSLQFTVVSHNPNNRIGVLYDRLSTYASYLGQQITDQCPLSPFYQDHNDVNFLNPILYGNEVPLATVVCQHLNYERQNGLVSLSLRMEGRIRWKVGSWTSGNYHLNVNCWAILGMSDYGIGGQVPLQPGTKCRVEV